MSMDELEAARRCIGRELRAYGHARIHLAALIADALTSRAALAQAGADAEEASTRVAVAYGRAVNVANEAGVTTAAERLGWEATVFVHLPYLFTVASTYLNGGDGANG